MLHLRNGLVIVKSENNDNISARISLTRKTLKSGTVKYAVVLTNLRSRTHNRLKSFGTISEAWGLYKSMMAI